MDRDLLGNSHLATGGASRRSCPISAILIPVLVAIGGVWMNLKVFVTRGGQIRLVASEE